MKAVCKKLFSLMLVAILLVSAVPFQVSAEEIGTDATTETITETTTDEVVETTEGDVMPVMDTPMLFGAIPKPTGLVEVYFQLEDGTQIGDGPVEAQMSEKVSPIPSAKEAKICYAEVNNGDYGMEFVRWYYKDKNGVKHNFDKNTYVHADMYFENGNELNVYAQIEAYAKEIRLNPNGGSVSTTKHQVKIGKTYNEMGTLPSPTREHYDFAYWVNESDNQPINGGTVVENFGNLKAYWTLKKYDVIFQAAKGDTWSNVSEFTFTGNYAVEANKTLKVADGYFPTDAQIKNLFGLDGWTIKGWEYTNDDGETWKEFKEGSTKITADTIIRPLYKKNITLHANDKGHTTRSLEVTLGKKLPILPHPGTREGFAFDGWYLDSAASADKLICSKENLANVSVHPVVGAGLSDLYAGWSPAKTVYLYIHTNGNTKEHTKLVRYYDVSVNGFNLKDIDLYEIFPNYGKYDDTGDEKWGWYDAAQWENFCLNKHKYETTEVVNAEYMSKDDVHEFYIMLIDNGNNTSNNNSYNDNKNTVDSSNPTTGDDIFVAVTIMAVSACAVLLIFMNKKRFIK